MQGVTVLFTMDQIVCPVQQIVRKGDVTLTRVTVWVVYRDIKGRSVVKVDNEFSRPECACSLIFLLSEKLK